MAATVPIAAPGWATDDRVWAQLLRFALVGGTASAVYGGLFLSLAGLGSQVANLIGVAVSTALANELHRRVTFRAGAGWATAQCAGGGMALAGLAASSLTLAALDAWTVSSGPLVAVLAVCAVSAAVGLVRFAGLRWVLVRNRAPLTMDAAPRSRAHRRADTGHRLASDVDLWAASASPDGAPFQVPLSFDRDGEALLLATPEKGPTGRNLSKAVLRRT
jgi:putative flippase GtrA